MTTTTTAAAKPAATPTSVGDYAILPLLLPTSASFPVQAKHYLYIRPNAPNIPTPTSDRELFLANIPTATSAGQMRALFAQPALGGCRVDGVTFPTSAAAAAGTATAAAAATGKKRKRSHALAQGSWPAPTAGQLRAGGDSCVVGFVDAASREGAMRGVMRAGRKGAVEWPAVAAGDTGRERYVRLAEGRYPDPGVLQEAVDGFVAAYNATEAERARAAAKAREMPDEDGFVTVTRGGRVGTARVEEAREKLEAQREKMKGRDDFYRFQVREQRKIEAGRLARGFEEERKRVRGMRERRGYRPE